MFRGIKVCIYWRDHMPPHFHAFYGGSEILVSIEELEVLEGEDFVAGVPSAMAGTARTKQRAVPKSTRLILKEFFISAVHPEG